MLKSTPRQRCAPPSSLPYSSQSTQGKDETEYQPSAQLLAPLLDWLLLIATMPLPVHVLVLCIPLPAVMGKEEARAHRQRDAYLRRRLVTSRYGIVCIHREHLPVSAYRHICIAALPCRVHGLNAPSLPFPLQAHNT